MTRKETDTKSATSQEGQVISMKATHIVKDSANEIVGYIVDESFYTDYYVRQNIQFIENLSILDYDVLRASQDLPEVAYTIAVNKTEYEKLVKENPFVRDVQTDLEEWKNDRLHKALQLEGSRQIGKTTELLKFAYKNYEYVIYVNLANDVYDFTKVVENGCKQLEFEKYCLRANLPHFVNGSNTILIIDEIQISEKVYNAIRGLFSEIKCDIVVTGSYLGQTIRASYFLPAGTISYVHMYPLSFSEFCRIYGREEQLKTIDLFGNGETAVYDKLADLYEIYKQIGGYPEVIKRYRETGNMSACYDVMENLLETFQKESRNYFQNSKEPLIFETVYIEAIKNMCNEKKGNGNKLVETITEIVKLSQKMMISREEITSAISWLIYSGMIGECGIYNNGDIKQYIPARRLYYMDCGIAAYIGKQSEIPESDINGLLTETFVFNELNRLYGKPYSKRLVKGTTPSFSTLNQYELDFMVLDTNNVIYGIEVKTTKGDPKSLKVFLDKSLVDKGIVAKMTKGGRGEEFDTIPIYTVGCRFPYN